MWACRQIEPFYSEQGHQLELGFAPGSQFSKVVLMLKTALTDWHAANGGKMVNFAGWSMPVEYDSIVTEHNAVRTAAGLFDVSHMGRLRFANDCAESLLERLATRKIEGMGVGRIRYSLMTNESGGILDDVLIYRLEELDGQVKFWMVVNASNREKILAWLLQHDPENTAGLEDRTMDTAMIAVQGPLAVPTVDKMLHISVADMKYYTGQFVLYKGYPLLVSRTGYTGEDGVELVPPAEYAQALWQEVMDAGKELGFHAAGLGARDTLRLEAAMPLYGHELGEDINPAQADLGFALTLKDRTFVGSQAIVAAAGDLSLRKRVGLELDGRRAAREHSPILVGGVIVGEITSGSFSPTLQKPIAMGYIDPGLCEIGTDVEVDIRGKMHSAKIVALPFYSRR